MINPEKEHDKIKANNIKVFRRHKGYADSLEQEVNQFGNRRKIKDIEIFKNDNELVIVCSYFEYNGSWGE